MRVFGYGQFHTLGTQKG